MVSFFDFLLFLVSFFDFVALKGAGVDLGDNVGSFVGFGPFLSDFASFFDSFFSDFLFFFGLLVGGLVGLFVGMGVGALVGGSLYFFEVSKLSFFENFNDFSSFLLPFSDLLMGVLVFCLMPSQTIGYESGEGMGK